MGNYVNKFFSSNEENEHKPKSQSVNPIDVANANMCTPPMPAKRKIDPRSVTAGIPRTPIEINFTPVLNRKIISAIPSHLQRKPYLETDIDAALLPLTPKKCGVSNPSNAELPKPAIITNDTPIRVLPIIKRDSEVLSSIERERDRILGLDPRSPAADFDRTPILKPKSMEHLKARSQQNLCRHGSYDIDVFYPRLSYCEMTDSFSIPEIQALPDITQIKAKSLTFLDANNANKNEYFYQSSASSSSSESVLNNEEDITVIQNPKLGQNTLHEQQADTRTAVQNNDKISGKSTKKHVGDIVSHTSNNEIIKVWRDSLSSEEQETEVVESDSKGSIGDTEPRVPKGEILIIFDDETVIENSRKTSVNESETLSTCRRSDGQKVKKFSKPDNQILTHKKNRTPLSNRSNNGKVQEIAINSPQQILRNKGIHSRIHQENTPPHKNYALKSRLNGMKWDLDSTIII